MNINLSTILVIAFITIYLSFGLRWAKQFVTRLGKGTKERLENSPFGLCCAYLHGDSDPQASNDALDRLNELISLGIPGGKPRVEKKLQEVQQQYPSYWK